MIPKIDLNKLVDTIKENIALSFLVDLEEVFGFPIGHLTAEQVAHKTIDNCIFNAIQSFETYTPLYIDIRLSLLEHQGDSYIFYDNFKQYLDGIVGENQISIIPAAVVNVHPAGQLWSLTGSRNAWYDQSTCRLTPAGSVNIWGSNNLVAYCICQRPFIHEYDNYGKYSEKSGFYYFSEADLLWSVFLKFCNMTVIRKILDLNKNLRLPSFPVEMFDSMDENYSNLKSELDEWGRNNITRGELVL